MNENRTMDNVQRINNGTYYGSANMICDELVKKVCEINFGLIPDYFCKGYR
jgi:hypothetical protein